MLPNSKDKKLRHMHLLFSSQNNEKYLYDVHFVHTILLSRKRKNDKIFICQSCSVVENPYHYYKETFMSYILVEYDTMNSILTKKKSWKCLLKGTPIIFTCLFYVSNDVGHTKLDTTRRNLMNNLMNFFVFLLQNLPHIYLHCTYFFPNTCCWRYCFFPHTFRTLFVINSDASLITIC